MEELIRNETQTIGTTAVIVAESVMPPNIRRAIVFTNVSTAGQVITLSWGKEATAGAGITLYPAGSWSETLDARFTPSQERIWAIADAITGTLAIHERLVG